MRGVPKFLLLILLLITKKYAGNNSIIIAFNKDVSDGKQSFINTSRSIFEAEFKIIEIDKIEEMKNIIKKENITHTYVQSPWIS